VIEERATILPIRDGLAVAVKEVSGVFQEPYTPDSVALEILRCA
jgi:hypothetical protein